MDNEILLECVSRGERVRKLLRDLNNESDKVMILRLSIHDMQADFESEIATLRAHIAELESQQAADGLRIKRVEGMLSDTGVAVDLVEGVGQLIRERDRYHDALIARHGGEPVALLSELDEARQQRDQLARFVRAIAEDWAAIGGGDIDGGWLQDIAERLGIFESYTPEPGSRDADAWGEDSTLYRLVPWLRGES